MVSNLWLLVLLLALSSMSVSGNVFVSIDCGASGNYTDENSILWRGDGDLISNGVTHVVQSNYSVSRVMDSLRVFTTRKKNCYSIEAEKGGKVLVRASFNYGNYDQKSTPPTFDLHFDGNFWVTVDASYEKTYEATYIVKRDVVSVCVAQTRPNQFPFISALEVRSVDSQVYGNIGADYALFTNIRKIYATNETIRFPVDPYDRIWLPATISDALVKVTNDASIINNNVPDNPPQEVFKNAITTDDITFFITLGLTISDYPLRYPVYINWYFTEVKELNATESRYFRIYKDDLPFSLPIVPNFGNVTEYFVSNHTVNANTNFSLWNYGESTLPPLINAIELFSISDALTNGTNNNDVNGLKSLQNTFEVLQQWGGDPCLPAPYSWEWIKCSDDLTPRVTSLDLNSFNLFGVLPDFSDMDALEIIDLHNNSLTGPIPNFLGALPNLKQLILTDNQFNGPIPRSISKNSKLNLSATGNPSLCNNDKSCPTSSLRSDKKKTNKLPVILATTIPVFLILCAIMGILLILRKRRKAGTTPRSGETSNGANDLYNNTRGIMSNYNFDDTVADNSKVNIEERFYGSPAPLLIEGNRT